MRYVANDGTEAAQREIVHRMIDWNRIHSRYERYPSIRRTFPLKIMKKGCEKPPYYCHYLAWRLGTWTNESLFQRFEELLSCAESLANWKHEKSLIVDAEFSTFWSLIWQLQVAEYLCKVGKEVRWAKSGPDLSVLVSDDLWYVECYSYQKSFALLSFLEEVLGRIDPAICVNYQRCSPFSLPNGEARGRFLHTILAPFLDPAYLAKHKKDAEQEYPVMLHACPASSLCVYVEGSDVDAYNPDRAPNVVGDPKSYLEMALREAVKAKADSNELARHRPNLVAVSYLLSTDFQLAASSSTTPSFPELGPNIDVVTASAVGIDGRLTRKDLKAVMVAENLEHRFSFGTHWPESCGLV